MNENYGILVLRRCKLYAVYTNKVTNDVGNGCVHSWFFLDKQQDWTSKSKKYSEELISNHILNIQALKSPNLRNN